MPIYTVTYCMKWRRTVFWNETFYKGSLGWQQVWEIPLVIEETLFATTSHPLLIITKFPGLPKCYIAPLQRKELSALLENDWFISATWSLLPSLSLPLYDYVASDSQKMEGRRWRMLVRTLDLGVVPFVLWSYTTPLPRKHTGASLSMGMNEKSI